MYTTAATDATEAVLATAAAYILLAMFKTPYYEFELTEAFSAALAALATAAYICQFAFLSE
jgi:hypothetical protein